MSRLIDDINSYREEFSKNVPELIQSKIQSAIEDLESLELSKEALKVGDVVKDFTLPNAVGKNITLDDLLILNDMI